MITQYGLEIFGEGNMRNVEVLPPYRVREFAHRADISPAQVYALVNRGEIPAIRLGRAIRLPREACDRLLAGEGRLDGK